MPANTPTASKSRSASAMRWPMPAAEPRYSPTTAPMAAAKPIDARRLDRIQVGR